jgi:Fe-S cluster biogenesis protein NfuA
MVTKEMVEQSLVKIRVGLQNDGGDISLVDIKEDVVYVRLTGACGCCPMAAATLKNYVEVTLKRDIPEIKAVEALSI